MSEHVTPGAAGVYSAPRFPFPLEAVRARREIVVASETGGFCTHSWAVVRDPACGLLAEVSGTVGVTRLPVATGDVRCMPWHHYSVQIPGFGHPHSHSQHPARICARVNRHMEIMREVIENSGRRIVVGARPLSVEDIDYDGPYQRISPARQYRAAFEAYAAQSVAPLGDVLFRTRGGKGPAARVRTLV